MTGARSPRSSAWRACGSARRAHFAQRPPLPFVRRLSSYGYDDYDSYRDDYYDDSYAYDRRHNKTHHAPPHRRQYDDEYDSYGGRHGGGYHRGRRLQQATPIVAGECYAFGTVDVTGSTVPLLASVAVTW